MSDMHCINSVRAKIIVPSIMVWLWRTRAGRSVNKLMKCNQCISTNSLDVNSLEVCFSELYELFYGILITLQEWFA